MAGEIVEIGSGVRKFKPGDKVVAAVNVLVSLLAHNFIFV